MTWGMGYDLRVTSPAVWVSVALCVYGFSSCSRCSKLALLSYRVMWLRILNVEITQHCTLSNAEWADTAFTVLGDFLFCTGTVNSSCIRIFDGVGWSFEAVQTVCGHRSRKFDYEKSA